MVGEECGRSGSCGFESVELLKGAFVRLSPCTFYFVVACPFCMEVVFIIHFVGTGVKARLVRDLITPRGVGMISYMVVPKS